MLWINGHTGWLGRLLGIMPPPGKEYWSSNYKYSARVTGDGTNNIYIDANDFFFSSSQKRFNNGYEYGRSNFMSLFEHYLLCGNSLKIIAHSQGVAFAEGLAAYLYNEKGIKVDETYYLQGSGLGTIPQVKEAVKYRVVFKTINDKIANKWNENIQYADVVITEKGLKTGFCKYLYTIYLPNGEVFSSLFIQKGRIIFMREHTAHRLRQYQVWSAIAHGNSVYRELIKKNIRKPEHTNSFSIESLYHLNYN